MTTTDHFLKKPYYYNTIDEYQKINEHIQTNPRYRNFYQTIFHAGDFQQFEEYSYYPDTLKGDLKDISKKNQSHELWKIIPNNLFVNISSIDIVNTFRYIFYKFKKGIYVKIRNNKIVVFLPFSNANYINEWSKLINIPNNDFFEKISKNEGRNFNLKKINKNKNQWYANNFLLRTEFPINEGDTGICQYKYILEKLCETGDVPDIDFFINRRDFPLLKKNLTEPYEDIYGINKELLSHKYTKYCPIFSLATTNDYADLLFPTSDDISRISGKYFNRNKEIFPNKFLGKWKDKIPKAVFRGSSTGRGVTIENNPRLKLASMMSKYPNLLDVAITKWNCRPRKYMNDLNLKTIDVQSLPFKLGNKMDYISQSNYKYIINIDGHSSAYRLSIEMNMGCVILMVDSPYYIWFKNYLRPYIEYIPIKSDLSDLIEKIEWCKTNDISCKKIALNARNFYKKYLTFNGVLDYMRFSLFEVRKNMGEYYFPIFNNMDTIKKNIIDKNNKKLREIYLIDYIKFCLRKSYINFNGKINNEILRLLISLKPGGEILKEKNNQICSNKNFNISIYTILNKEIICKKSDTVPIHEVFIGLYGVNKIIDKIPNFSYTYGIIGNSIYKEHVIGQSFFEYLTKDKNVDMKFIISSLVQILLSIQVAQDTNCFIHYDLYPWNIILSYRKNSIIEYVISPFEIYKVKTDFVPVIIDFNKSSVIYGKKEDIHYGGINPYKASFFQDPLTILVSLFNILLTKKFLNKEQLNTISRIISFISCSEYYPERHVTIPNLKEFLAKAHKYDNIYNCNKGRLWNIRPIELIKHILSIFPISEITVSSIYLNNISLCPLYDTINLFNYPEKIEIMSIYENILEKILTTNIEKSDIFTDRIYVYFFYQKLWKIYGNILIENNMENLFDIYFLKNINGLYIRETIKTNPNFITHEGFNKEDIIKDIPKIKQLSITPEYRNIIVDILIYRGKYELEIEDRKIIENIYKSYNWEEILDKFRFNGILRNISK